MRQFIKNIKGLQGIYTVEEVRDLLGLTETELEDLCERHGLWPYETNGGEHIFTSYGYLTLNNRLYREECQAAGVEPIIYD